jgi:hypothetical protein
VPSLPQSLREAHAPLWTVRSRLVLRGVFSAFHRFPQPTSVPDFDRLARRFSLVPTRVRRATHHRSRRSSSPGRGQAAQQRTSAIAGACGAGRGHGRL